jgi:hypothetical protein
MSFGSAYSKARQLGSTIGALHHLSSLERGVRGVTIDGRPTRLPTLYQHPVNGELKIGDIDPHLIRACANTPKPGTIVYYITGNRDVIFRGADHEQVVIDIDGIIKTVLRSELRW